MIVTRTPFRMSFFGGGTDMPEFFSSHGGAVLSTTFDKYCYVSVRRLPPFFDYASELVYARTERVRDRSQIEHPLIRNVMQMLDIDGIRLTYDGDLPARTGLGTSSSFAVGMLNAFHAMRGEAGVTKRQLADEAIRAERVLCAEAGGWQDQIAAAYGGLNRIDFSGDSFEVRPITLPDERAAELQGKLMLFFTGYTRLSSKVQATVRYRDKTSELLDMMALVDEAERVLANPQGPLDEFGRLLDTAWQLKRDFGSKISTDGIDDLYTRARRAGALGGKLLGAGGGGFLLFYVPQEAQEGVRAALQSQLMIPFRFESEGSKILYCELDG